MFRKLYSEYNDSELLDAMQFYKSEITRLVKDIQLHNMREFNNAVSELNQIADAYRKLVG